MNLHLISFCSPEKNYDSTRNRFHNEALNLGVFKSINLFSERNCFSYCDDLWNIKIYGIYKSIWFLDLEIFLISELMKSIPEDDVIFYADIGCTFNIVCKRLLLTNF